jgi:HSP20 family molecular chaperone IbpA
MFSVNRGTTFNDIFNFQSDIDRVANQVWNELPPCSSRTASSPCPFHVVTDRNHRRMLFPMPGIDPKMIAVDVTGNTIAVRAEQAGGSRDGEMHYEQTITVPPLLELGGLAATHRHGMLELTLPVKDGVKPRRIEIAGIADAHHSQKQIATP